MNFELLLIQAWETIRPFVYIGGAVLIAVVARLVTKFFRTLELFSENDTPMEEDFRGTFRTFRALFWETFKSMDPSRDEKADYWTPFMLGFLESLAYPVLMSINKWEYIGGWLVLKTVFRWKEWSEERTVYNRFLIGNAMVFIGAYILLGFSKSIVIRFY